MLARSKTVSGVLARLAMAAVEKHGVGPREFRQRTGISELELRDPQIRIPAAKHLAMLRLTSQFPVAPEYFQLLDIRHGLTPFPTLAAMLANCDNLGEALSHYLAYRELIGEIDDVMLRRDGTKMEVEYGLESEECRSSRCAYFNLALLAGLMRIYDPEDGRVLSLELTGRPFAPLHLLREAIDCDVRFEQSRNRLVLSSPGADTPISWHNPYVYRFSLNQAKSERDRLWGLRSFARRVECFLVESIGGGELLDGSNPLFEATCIHFGTSRSGLQRRLQREATNFQDIFARVRAEEAKRLLSQDGLSIAAIGDLLGFSSLSAFSRFFSEYCGQPPSRFRDAYAIVPA
jgi:AraC-like DNA-binding protein